MRASLARVHDGRPRRGVMRCHPCQQRYAAPPSPSGPSQRPSGTWTWTTLASWSSRLLLHRPASGHQGHRLAVHRHRRGLRLHLGDVAGDQAQSLGHLDQRAGSTGGRRPGQPRLEAPPDDRGALDTAVNDANSAPATASSIRPTPDQRLCGAGPADHPGRVLEAGLSMKSGVISLGSPAARSTMRQAPSPAGDEEGRRCGNRYHCGTANSRTLDSQGQTKG
jgi:hypothetical protein